jgi:LAS superfamily LD-carboxypeptidase LdcB
MYLRKGGYHLVYGSGYRSYKKGEMGDQDTWKYQSKNNKGLA